MSKISADMEALGVQSDIGRRYILALDRMEATLRKELEENTLHVSNSTVRYHPQVYASAARRHGVIENRIKAEILKLARARRLVPMVEAGLMTAAEAMKSVLGDP